MEGQGEYERISGVLVTWESKIDEQKALNLIVENLLKVQAAFGHRNLKLKLFIDTFVVREGDFHSYTHKKTGCDILTYDDLENVLSTGESDE